MNKIHSGNIKFDHPSIEQELKQKRWKAKHIWFWNRWRLTIFCWIWSSGTNKHSNSTTDSKMQNPGWSMCLILDTINMLYYKILEWFEDKLKVIGKESYGCSLRGTFQFAEKIKNWMLPTDQSNPWKKHHFFTMAHLRTAKYSNK